MQKISVARFLHSGVLFFSLLIVLIEMPNASASTLPIDFDEIQIASGLIQPTAMVFAPDGRLFILEKAGKVRVIKKR